MDTTDIETLLEKKFGKWSFPVGLALGIVALAAAIFVLFVVLSPAAHAQGTGTIVEQGQGGRFGSWSFTQGPPSASTAIAAPHAASVTVVGTTSTIVLASYSARRGGGGQNQGTVAACCGFASSITASSCPFSLKASATAYDGTGGPFGIQSPYTGPIYCIVSGGTTQISAFDQ